MDTSSFFIEEKAIFGCFPTKETVEELETHGVRYFVDLTTPEEKESKVKPYTTNYTYISYPILDRSVPNNWQTYAKFIITLCEIIDNLKHDEKIYINCVAGHGRSGIIVASILCQFLKYSPDHALESTKRYHGNRKSLKDKWRKIGSPQTYSQKKFIYKFFYPLKFFKSYKNSNTFGFSNFSPHLIKIDGIGTFHNAESAFQAHKDLDDKDYIATMLLVKTGLEARNIGNKKTPTEFWEKNKIEIMKQILYLKIEQNEDVYLNLVNTGLRPLVSYKNDIFWGDNGDGTGKNILGKLLTEIREEIYIRDF